MWFDFDIINEKPRVHFYPSNLSPLWAECYDVTRREQVKLELHALLTKQLIRKKDTLFHLLLLI